jgi:hypothetical protein
MPRALAISVAPIPLAFIGEDNYARERMIIHIETAMFALALAVVVYEPVGVAR